MKREVFDEYAKKVCELFEVEHEKLFSKNRKSQITEARQMLYYLCWSRPMKVVEIQRHMRDRGYSTTHSTIVHGYQRVAIKIAEDADYADAVQRMV